MKELKLTTCWDWLARQYRAWAEETRTCYARFMFSPSNCPKQREINRLRRVLHDIVDSRPDDHMDMEREPKLVKWICETCRKASVGAYNAERNAGGGR